MERRPSGLGVADILDLAAVEPLPGVPQHDALLLLPGRLDVHTWRLLGRDSVVNVSLATRWLTLA